VKSPTQQTNINKIRKELGVSNKLGVNITKKKEDSTYLLVRY
jgi:hypothetical protein